MTDYHFTGAYPRVLSGLSQGVNATLSPVSGDAPPHGATIEAAPGDTLHTDAPYVHPELVEIEAPAAAAEPAPAPEPEPAPAAEPAAEPVPAPADPAPAPAN